MVGTHVGQHGDGGYLLLLLCTGLVLEARESLPRAVSRPWHSTEGGVDEGGGAFCTLEDEITAPSKKRCIPYPGKVGVPLTGPSLQKKPVRFLGRRPAIAAVPLPVIEHAFSLATAQVPDAARTIRKPFSFKKENLILKSEVYDELSSEICFYNLRISTLVYLTIRGMCLVLIIAARPITLHAQNRDIE